MSDADLGDELIYTKGQLLQIFSQLDKKEVDIMERWINSQSFKTELEQRKLLNKSEREMKKIGQSIKKLIPFEAEMPTENIVMPTVGDQADCTKLNTCHVDEFLYNDDQVDELVKEGQISRHYCLDCNSRNIKDLTFISHSMSRKALQFLFKVLLPKDLDGKQILDVGSRIGAVVFGAYLLSNVRKIIGVEMNTECCEIQKKIIKEFSMDTNRIKIVHSDIMEEKDIVGSSDIIIINVLDFFIDIQKHKDMWHFFKNNIKKGSYIVCNRSISKTLLPLDLYEDYMDWLTFCNACQLENEVLFDYEEIEYSDLFLYKVK